MPWTDPAKFNPTGVVIVDTKYMPLPAGEAFEITIAADHGSEAKRQVLVTTDAAIYERALKAEGSERRFTASSHPGYRPDGKACRVLVSLIEAKGTNAQIESVGSGDSSVEGGTGRPRSRDRKDGSADRRAKVGREAAQGEGPTAGTASGRRG
jgi:hypothetical protein